MYRLDNDKYVHSIYIYIYIMCVCACVCVCVIICLRNLEQVNLRDGDVERERERIEFVMAWEGSAPTQVWCLVSQEGGRLRGHLGRSILWR